MALTDAKRKANNKYIAANMTVLGCKVRKDKAERFKAVCKLKGTSPNAIFTEAMDSFLIEHDKAAPANNYQNDIPNAETIAAMQEVNEMIRTGSGQHFKGSAAELFAMLDAEDDDDA